MTTTQPQTPLLCKLKGCQLGWKRSSVEDVDTWSGMCGLCNAITPHILIGRCIDCSLKNKICVSCGVKLQPQNGVLSTAYNWFATQWRRLM
jgi:hypothetical protein